MQYITNDDSSDKSDKYNIIKESPKDISDEPVKQSEDIIKPIPINKN
jgi:hypothetical protein